jgi:NADH dehydrogenase I D subunit
MTMADEPKAGTTVERDADPTAHLETKDLTLNLGPQHPATHGVLRLEVDLDGFTVVRCTPHVGYLHRGVEKLAENRNYLQIIPLTDRLDYVSSMTNNDSYCTAVERLCGIEVPERALYIRTMVAEMSRIASHLLMLATHALDIGAMTVFLYCFREREKLLDLFERLCGARLTVSYPRIGGVQRDTEDEWLEDVYAFTEEFPGRVDEYETLIDQNRIWLQRTKGVGVISSEEAINWGLSGPTLRGCGVPYDVRKFAPYGVYDRLDWEVPTGSNGDVYDRYRVRMEEFRQSNSIVRQCIEALPSGPFIADAPKFVLPAKEALFENMESLIHQFALITDGPPVPAGELYVATETPRGEFGVYIVSDGSGKPYRMKIRTPSFVHISALTKLCKGGRLADVIAIIGSIDIVMGECDR